nr:hypothetical protein [Tanacetum cinerariifolium]
AFGGVAQQERQAEKQQHYADTQHGIAAQKPFFGAQQCAVEHIGYGGNGRFSRRANGFRDVGRSAPFGVAGELGRCGFQIRQVPEQFRTGVGDRLNVERSGGGCIR